MFEQILRHVEAELDIPYPRRSEVIRELESDLLAQYAALREEGFSQEAACDAVLRDMGLDAHALTSLQLVHNPFIRRILLRLPEPAREPVEWLCAGLPLIAVLYILLTEVPMLDFLRQGGSAMWIIMFVGGAGLLLQLRSGFSWFVSRDHSPRSMGRNTTTPLYLAGATFALAMMATGLNFYVVLRAWSLGMLEPGQLPIGLMESLSTLIMGSALATLIVLFQGALQAGLRALQVRAAA